jgi:hypothetical protein
VVNHTVLFSFDCPTAIVILAKDPVKRFREIRQDVVLLARKDPSTKPVNREIVEVT